MTSGRYICYFSSFFDWFSSLSLRAFSALFSFLLFLYASLDLIMFTDSIVLPTLVTVMVEAFAGLELSAEYVEDVTD